jgi:hypothetical protein
MFWRLNRCDLWPQYTYEFAVRISTELCLFNLIGINSLLWLIAMLLGSHTSLNGKRSRQPIGKLNAKHAKHVLNMEA